MKDLTKVSMETLEQAAELYRLLGLRGYTEAKEIAAEIAKRKEAEVDSC